MGVVRRFGSRLFEVLCDDTVPSSYVTPKVISTASRSGSPPNSPIPEERQHSQAYRRRTCADRSSLGWGKGTCTLNTYRTHTTVALRSKLPEPDQDFQRDQSLAQCLSGGCRWIPGCKGSITVLLVLWFYLAIVLRMGWVRPVGCTALQRDIVALLLWRALGLSRLQCSILIGSSQVDVTRQVSCFRRRSDNRCCLYTPEDVTHGCIMLQQLNEN
ncbi:hypothetical protein GGR55DRAFT_39787 [Xylaria sp. FL0064]|nr:hypothetical protein GGR55DRAFT_39787 [Xylaria sp. FL0064]